MKRTALIVAVVVALALGAVVLIPSLRVGAVGAVKYPECLRPGGDGPATVALGDSITAGHHFGPLGASDSYADVLACSGDVPMDYANKGVWFETSAELLDRLPEAASDADRVLLLTGTNDVRNGTAADTVANIAQARQALADQGAEVFVGLLPPSDDYPAEVERLNAAIAEWAEREGVAALDFWSPLAAEDGTFRPGMDTDGIHPSPDGAAVMAEVAENALS